MKIHVLAILPLVSLFTCSFNAFGSPLNNQILKIKPQADRNGDGTLSDAEKAAMKKMIIKRFPRSDSDRDGDLSEKELEVVIRIATTRDKMQKRQNSGKVANRGQMPPTHANVKYGKDERNIFDIWLAESDQPTPLAIYIHGGGFRAGSKEKLSNDILSQLLKAGISVASINYRYLSIDTPLPTSHHDARRALQFMRSKAGEWNIDKSRFAAFGGSAGAQICMWLAYSNDMAKPKSKDPIKRESTRLTCVATTGGQTTNKSEFWKEMIIDLMGSQIEAEGFVRPLGTLVDPEKVRMATWGASSLEEASRIASQHSALSIISKDAPPIFMTYGMDPSAKPPTDRNRLRGWIIHHVNLGIALKEKTDALELEAHLKYPGADLKYPSQIEFLVDKLLN
jgi:acetyl esterase/lipase